MCGVLIVGTAARSAAINHYKKLAKHPLYGSAEVVFIVESNGDWMRARDYAETITNSVYFRGGFTVVSNDSSGENKPGVHTTHEAKEFATCEVSSILEAGNLHIVEQRHMITANADSTPEKEVYELVAQMKRWRRPPPKESKTPEYNNYKPTTQSGKAHGVHDDLSMCLQQNIAQTLLYNDSNRHGRFQQRVFN